MNRQITRSEIEAAINSLSTKKKSRIRWVHNQILPGVQRGAGTIPSETTPNNRKGGHTPYSFYEANIILIPNLAETQLQKKFQANIPDEH